MSAERSINSQEQQLSAMPAEARALCEWGWTTLRDVLIGWCRALGMDPLAATRTASRVARLVCTQVYADVLDYRRFQHQAKRAVILALLLAAPAVAAAQTPTPVSQSHRLAWDQDGPSLAIVQAYQYFVIVDGVRTTQPILPIQCTGAATPFVCSTPFPALTPGPHDVGLHAAELVNGVLNVSPPSVPIAIAMRVTPLTPRNLRVQPPAGQ